MTATGSRVLLFKRRSKRKILLFRRRTPWRRPLPGSGRHSANSLPSPCALPCRRTARRIHAKTKISGLVEFLDSRDHDAHRVFVSMIDDNVSVVRIGDGRDDGRNPQKASRAPVQPGVADGSGQALIGAPVAGQVLERRFFDPQVIGHVVTHEHGIVGQQAGVFDMYEFLQYAESGAGGAIGDRALPLVLSALVVESETAIETLRVVRPRQAPYPHQAGAPQWIRASRFSTIRAPASVWMHSMGVRPPRAFRFR